MTKQVQCIYEHLALALALAALAVGCGESHPQVDSSTNWLHACESSAECGNLSCLCGVCNATCAGDGACAGLDANAECSVDPEQGLCGNLTQNVCILRCSADTDCAAGLTCQDSLCADPAVTASFAGDDAGATVEFDASLPDYGFDFTQITVGGRHTCGLVSDGSMLCWGSDFYGALGGAADAAADFTQLAAGGYHTCGLRADGSLSCWGRGNLEVGQVTGPNADASADFTYVAAGDQHTCAVRSDGSVTCWGLDNYGQVSGPNADGGTFTQLAGGYEHTCALRSDGSLICWGRNLSSEVSGPNGVDDTDFTQVAAGAGHTCALRNDGSLVCWGTAEWEDEVSGPNADSSGDFVQVMTAAYQTCALRSDTTIRCWGDDSQGQVSGANAPFTAGFKQLSGSIEVDGNHLCALQNDGTVSCWGDDTHAQLSGLDELALRPR